MDICPCNICPGDICPYQQYLSYYWPDFDQTLKVGSMDCFEQILTVICQHNICPCDICPYQNYLSCYWSDFGETLKLGFWTIFKKYQVSQWHLSRKHLSCSGISRLLLTQFQPNFLDPKFFWTQHFFCPWIKKKSFLNKLFCSFLHNIFVSKIVFGHNNFYD